MANYEHLPIFKKMMDLAVFMEQTVRHFSRYHKYTLGSELRTMCHEALALIVEANSLPGGMRGAEQQATGGTASGPEQLHPAGGAVSRRHAVLLQLRVLLEKIKIHLVIAKEVQAYHSRNSFVQATEMAVDLCRQNEGWIRSTAAGAAGGKTANRGRGSDRSGS